MRRKLWRKRIPLLVTFVVCVLYFSGKLVPILENTKRDFKSVDELPVRGIHFERTGLDFAEENSKGPKRLVNTVNCKAIVAGDANELALAKAAMENPSSTVIPDSVFVNITRNCEVYVNSRGFLDHPVALEELEFPIAYSILLYKEVYQFEKLLRTIYRPQNLYCIHVDADSPKVVHEAVDSIAGCLDNVFIVSRKEYIVYAGFTRLQADLNCMADLLNAKKPWKYFINLPSQQFPLKTNLEIVKILQIYNGANDIEGLTGRRLLPGRIKNRHIYKHVDDQMKPKIVRTNAVKDFPPRNVTVVKGSAYGVFSRQFVDFIVNSKVARELLDWFRDTLSPDEYYWATLNFNPQIGTPGAFKGKPEDKKAWLAVYAAWGGQDKCAGKFVRGVCVFGVGDLQSLVKRRELFANKFFQGYQPLALDCLEEWYNNQTYSKESFNVTYYQTLPFIRKTSL